MARPSKFTPEYREEAIRLYRESGATIAETARRLGLHPETFRKWLRQGEVEAGTRSGTTSVEHAEIVRLKREVRRLEEEKLILQKAAAYLRGRPVSCHDVPADRSGAAAPRCLAPGFGAWRHAAGSYAWRRRPVSARRRTESASPRSVSHA